MTITRIYQDGFESTQYPYEARWVHVDTVPAITSSLQYTGDYAQSWSTTQEGIYIRNSAALTQIKSGFMFRDSGSGSGTTQGIFFLTNGYKTNDVLNVYYNSSTNTWYAYAGATELGNWVNNTEDNTYRHFGIDFKCDASSGWCNIYFDGVAQLTYSGQTTYGDTEFDCVGIGPLSNSYGGWSSLYIDDFYLDNSSGEATALPPAKKRFFPLDVNGTGNYAQWYGDDGDQTNNYLRIISGLSVINAKTGMIESQTSTHRDSWTLENTPAAITVSDDIPAVICDYLVVTRDVESGTQIRQFLRYSATDSDGDALDVPVSWNRLFSRFTLDPTGAAWTKTAIDSLEAGIKFE